MSAGRGDQQEDGGDHLDGAGLPGLQHQPVRGVADDAQSGLETP